LSHFYLSIISQCTYTLEISFGTHMLKIGSGEVTKLQTLMIRC